MMTALVMSVIIALRLPIMISLTTTKMKSAMYAITARMKQIPVSATAMKMGMVTFVTTVRMITIPTSRIMMATVSGISVNIFAETRTATKK